MDDLKSSISFVIPCLNEQETLPEVLAKIKRVCETDFKQRRTEIIVSDNNSTDNSVKIAEEHGARIVNCAERGYGAALLCGIRNAACETVIFADADNTYDFLEAPKLISELEKGFDLVIGSRLQGCIHPGAMPFLHRYLGTPFLNWLLNLLYAKKNNKIADCNSGFRCFRRDSFLSWGVKSFGMEFASEMLIKALKADARISHVPISLYPDVRHRVPHLKRWRDGMRHLLQIFLDCPQFFAAAGLVIFCISWLVMALGLRFGPVQIGFVWVLGVHSMMFALLGSLFGITIWSVGLFLTARIRTTIKAYSYFIEMSEDKLFWVSFGLTVVSLALFLAIVIYWGVKGFRLISLEKQTLAVIAFASNSLLLVSSVVTAHLLKRS